MRIWHILEILMAFSGVCGTLYLGFRFSEFLNFKNKIWQKIAGVVFIMAILGLLVWQINFMNAVICLVYTTAIWLICDFINFIAVKIRGEEFKHYYSGIAAVAISVLYLVNGWYQAHHVWATLYELTTAKELDDLRIIQFADSHIGTTFNGQDFAKHVAKMQSYNPDIVVITGDFVDNGTSKEDFIKTLEALSSLKSRFGTYFVPGNHDKSSNGKAYRGFSNDEMITEIQKYGIKVLQDEAVLINNQFYLIGRKDASEPVRGGYRKPISEVIKGLDTSKYMIVLDHQPTDYENQAVSKVDLVLSGHTHGGQLFPLNNISKWLKINDNVYGYERYGQTDFIVTSGISDWEVKFKTGCKSEFTVIDIKNKL